MRGLVMKSVMRSTACGRVTLAGALRVCLATFAAAFLLVSCVSPPDGVDVVKGRELDDIPVKTGLEFVKSETYAPPLSEGSRFRSWMGLYRGKGLIQEIGPWYVGAMKSQGWTFTGVVESKGPTYSYNFLKRDEEAVIRVYREYTLSSGRSINMVRAEVHPRGTESFLPEDLETMKATGVAWMEPDVDEVDVNQEVQTISFTEEVGQSPAPAASDFLLNTPALEPSPPKSPGTLGIGELLADRLHPRASR